MHNRRRAAAGVGISLPSMPIVIEYQDSYTAAGPIYNVAPAITGALIGDTWIALRASASATPSGFTAGPTVVISAMTIYTYYKAVASNGEAHGVAYDVGNNPYCVILVRDVDLSTPIEEITGAYLTTNNAALNYPAATSASNDTLACLLYVNAAGSVGINSVSMASLANLTEVSEGNTSSSFGFDGLWTGEKATAGSISAGTGTLAASRTNKRGITMLLNPG